MSIIEVIDAIAYVGAFVWGLTTIFLVVAITLYIPANMIRRFRKKNEFDQEVERLLNASKQDH